MVDPGNLVSAGGSVGNTVNTSTTGTTNSTTTSTNNATGIVIVNQIEPIAVTFSVPQGDFQHLSDLSGGFRKPLATKAFSQDTGALLGSGELSIADNRVDPASGTVEMKARFPNSAKLLLPGQFVNVQLTLQTLAHATTIPAVAVIQGPNGPFVYVVGARQTVSMRSIKVGWTQETAVVIASGLKPGETVVTDGQMSLKAGLTVKVSKPAPAKQPAS
jgi:multidrug efflux system membrane fusion protein